MNVLNVAVDSVSFAYPGDGQACGLLSVLREVSFHTGVGRISVIVGPSGCGKSTLLNLVAGLLKPTSGGIHFHESVGVCPRRTAYVFQTPTLVPWLSVKENVLLGAELTGRGTSTLEEDCREGLVSLGLAGFEDSRPHAISGGMQQRAALLRALISGVKVLLLDEPFANSDYALRRQLQEKLSVAIERDGLIALLVTHDLMEAVRMADKIIVLSARPATVIDCFDIPIPRIDRLRGVCQALRELPEWVARIERALMGERPAKAFVAVQ